MLGGGGDGGGSNGPVLFNSAEHGGLVGSTRSVHHITDASKLTSRRLLTVEGAEFQLHGELALDRLEVPDVGGDAVEKRNLAGLPAGGGKRGLEATVTLPEFVTPRLFRTQHTGSGPPPHASRGRFRWREE